jgi:tRNA dimethylallyltransferase
MEQGTLIAVGGPTASGKTAVSIELAKVLGTEIISADSRQFFKEMSIGTARPSTEEMAGIVHHFVGHLSITECMSAGAFAEAALPISTGLIQKTGSAICVGGSGLYMDALCYGLNIAAPADDRLRQELSARLNTDGIEALVQELEELDPACIPDLDTKNPHRVMRALEICLVTGKPFSEQKKERTVRPEFKLRKVAINWNREQLYDRINQRVDGMMDDGLLDEVNALLPYRDLPALNTVGYKELFAHLDGACGLEEAVEKIKQHTRNYAKRQITWMRRHSDWEWFEPGTLISDLLKQ